jgi:sulfoxide reductase heme-binding subunit YedZ
LQRSWPLGVALLALIPAAAQAAYGSVSPTLDYRVWEMIRASGLIAYVLLSVSMIVGIAVRVRALDWLMKRAWVLEGHQMLSILALIFTASHMTFTLMNQYVPFSLAGILVPFASGWRPAATVLGIVAFYLLVLLTFSSWLRPVIGQKAWRTIHYSAFAVWVMALGHGVFAGSDTSVPWVQWMYLLSAAAVGFLIVFRVLTARPMQSQTPNVRFTRSPNGDISFEEAGPG